MDVFTCTVSGPPRTKKNHTRRMYSFKLKRTITRQSEAQELWSTSARWQLKAARRGAPLIGDRVAVRALFYRKTAVGDLDGYTHALGDALQGTVILDDRLIASWDGSRLRKDAVNPRVEVEVRLYDPNTDGP